MIEDISKKELLLIEKAVGKELKKTYNKSCDEDYFKKKYSYLLNK